MFASRVWSKKCDEGLELERCHFVEGEPKFQRMKVGLKGISYLSVFWVLKSYSEVNGVSINLFYV